MLMETVYNVLGTILVIFCGFVIIGAIMTFVEWVRDKTRAYKENMEELEEISPALAEAYTMNIQGGILSIIGTILFFPVYVALMTCGIDFVSKKMKK